MWPPSKITHAGTHAHTCGLPHAGYCPLCPSPLQCAAPLGTPGASLCSSYAPDSLHALTCGLPRAGGCPLRHLHDHGRLLRGHCGDHCAADLHQVRHRPGHLVRLPLRKALFDPQDSESSASASPRSPNTFNPARGPASLVMNHQSLEPAARASKHRFVAVVPLHARAARVCLDSADLMAFCSQPALAVLLDKWSASHAGI